MEESARWNLLDEVRSIEESVQWNPRDRIRSIESVQWNLLGGGIC